MTDEPQPAGEQQPISVDDLAELYPGQRIFMKVTACDEHEVATHGIVLAAGPTRDSIQQIIMETLLSAREPGLGYYVTGGYRRIRTQEEWLEVLNRALEKDRSRGRRCR